MIKSNIDLTVNEIFSRRSKNDSVISLFSKVFHEYPWDIKVVFVESEFENQKYEPIYTGNKNDRYYKTLAEQECTGDYCECCGTYLKSIPWDRTFGLCRRCIDDMERNYGNNDEKYSRLWGYKKRCSRIEIQLLSLGKNNLEKFPKSC